MARLYSKVNGPALGATGDLEEFLFGSERADLSGMRPGLRELQAGRCFCCAREMTQPADVDHFIPWAPVDLGHNFVLAKMRLAIPPRAPFSWQKSISIDGQSGTNCQDC
jgi:hypothetical protein